MVVGEPLCLGVKNFDVVTYSVLCTTTVDTHFVLYHLLAP